MKSIYSKNGSNVSMISGIPPGGILEGQYAGRVKKGRGSSLGEVLGSVPLRFPNCFLVLYFE
jgi:hypothetical protein